MAELEQVEQLGYPDTAHWKGENDVWPKLSHSANETVIERNNLDLGVWALHQDLLLDGAHDGHFTIGPVKH